MAEAEKEAPSEEQWADSKWRLHNVYKIKNKAGQTVDFRPNPEQQRYLDEIHTLNIVLKARRLGFTTLNCLIMLDAALFIPNTACALIAHTDKAAEEIFRNIIKFAYDNLPDELRSAVSAKNDRANQYVFSNGSSIFVTTSTRSGTYQYLHVSEFGKICAKYPDRAREIVTGSFEAVDIGQYICVESTAEGQEGAFFDMAQTAQRLLHSGGEITGLDFKFHFFPWHESKDNSLEANFPIPKEYEEYFLSVGLHNLTDGQKRWYVKKDERLGSDMKREFPSTPGEAFEQAIEGAYFARELEIANKQGRIGMYPVIPTIPVNTFWDLGMDDYTAIWFHQSWQGMDRFVGYYENSGEKIEHYARFVKDWARENDVIFGEHYAPHDIKKDDMFYDDDRMTKAARLGLPFIRVPRISHKQDAIDATRTRFRTALFDTATCNIGLARLRQYRKEWDEKRGVWKKEPRHDENSHGADAFMQWATGFIPPMLENDRDEEYGSRDGRNDATGY